jgi:hypothetical protein
VNRGLGTGDEAGFDGGCDDIEGCDDIGGGDDMAQAGGSPGQLAMEVGGAIASVVVGG